MSVNLFQWNSVNFNQSVAGGLIAANFEVVRALEGPQIVCRWDPPGDVDKVLSLRLVRQIRQWSLDQDDGVILLTVSDPASGPNEFSDLTFISRATFVADASVENRTARYAAGSLVGSTLIPNAAVPEVGFPIIGNTQTQIFVAAGTMLDQIIGIGTEYAVDPPPPDNSPRKDTFYYYTLFSELEASPGVYVSGPAVRGKALALETGYFQFQTHRIVPPAWRVKDAVPRDV